VKLLSLSVRYIFSLAMLRGLISYFKNYKILVKNKRFKDLYKGETVVILGNGPSVNNDIELVKSSQYVIVMNNFFKSEVLKDIKPVAYCVGEPVSSNAWSNPDHIINNSNAKSYWLHGSNIPAVKNLKNKDVQFVIPAIIPNSSGVIGSPASVTLGFHTTAVLSIQIAIYLGFEDIRLVGFDHSWLATPTQLAHFYSDTKDVDDVIGEMSYLDLIKSCESMWLQYLTIKKYAENTNILITNCTRGSYLDVFVKEI